MIIQTVDYLANVKWTYLWVVNLNCLISNECQINLTVSNHPICCTFKDYQMNLKIQHLNIQQEYQMHDESHLYTKLFKLSSWISNECQMNLDINNSRAVESLMNVKWTLMWTIIGTVESLKELKMTWMWKIT